MTSNFQAPSADDLKQNLGLIASECGKKILQPEVD